MKSIEDICREYEKDPMAVEATLCTLLRHPEIRITSDNIVDNNFYAASKQYLLDNAYIVQGEKGYQRTSKGETAKARGWVCFKKKEYKAQKTKELIKSILFYISVLASITAAITSILALFRN